MSSESYASLYNSLNNEACYRDERCDFWAGMSIRGILIRWHQLQCGLKIPVISAGEKVIRTCNTAVIGWLYSQ